MLDYHSTEILVLRAKALAHLHRVQIIKLLLTHEACLCQFIVSELPLAQSTVSQHLKILKTAGIIKAVNKGPSVIYSLEKHSIHGFQDLIQRLLGN